MIKLHKAPYKITDKKIKKKFGLYNSIYSSNPDQQFSKLKSMTSLDGGPGTGLINSLPNGMQRQDSVQGNTTTDVSSIPVYQDELALSRFLEEYLDYFVEYIFKQKDILGGAHKG